MPAVPVSPGGGFHIRLSAAGSIILCRNPEELTQLSGECNELKGRYKTMQISIYGILFVVSIILIMILISIQFTLNQILKELRILKNKLSYRNEDQDVRRFRQ